MLLLSFISYFAAGVATFTAFTLSVPRRRAPGGRWLALALLITTVWMWSNAVLHTLFPYEIRIAAAQISLFGGISGVLFFYFAIEYSTPGTRVDGWKSLLLPLFAFSFVLATFFPAFRSLVWSDVYLDPAGTGILIFQWGPAYLAMVASGLALNVMSITQIGQTAARTYGAHRRQALIVLFGFVAPTVAFGAAALVPGTGLGLYPAIAMVMSGVAFSLGLLSVGLLRSVPVGRREFVDSLVDGFLVTDIDGEVVDANPAASRILVGNPAQQILGRPYESVFSEWLCNGAPCTLMSDAEMIINPANPASLTRVATQHDVRAASRVVLRSWDIRDVTGAVIGRAFALRDETLDEMARRRLETAASSIAGWTREMGAVEELLKKVR